MLRLLSRTLGEDILVESRLAADPAGIFVDQGGLENAIVNLALNARAAMPKGGTLTLASRNLRLDAEMVVEGGILPAGDYVEIVILDTGCGMSEEVMSRAFEPFFTTREVGKGSGLGLSMVYGFVRQSDGNVTLESLPERGTAVRILLLAAGRGGEAVADEKVAPVEQSSTRTILVVEDNEQVRDATVALARGFGCVVREAGDPETALNILGRDPTIDLLLSDVVMPGGRNGIELARDARQNNPALTIVLMSGYPEAELERLGLSDAGFRILRKPFTRSELWTVLIPPTAG